MNSKSCRDAGLAVALLLLTTACAREEAPDTTTADRGLDRTVLPIHEPAVTEIKELDARNATPPPRFDVKAPEGAPNVVIVLIDDIGFGASSAFGGPIQMPTLEKMAGNGLRYNRFHTTALCSPTRVALLTGRNHHVNNAGAIMELATGFPGNTGIRPQSVTPLAQILRMNGYSTAAFGKYHETPPWEVSTSGPFDRWPTGSGFDKFYGFIGGETNQWAPAIFDGVTRVEHDMSPNYHFTTDMTNQAVQWVSAQHSLTPDKPFYVYFATGATHAPHHAPKEWIAKYKGQFAGGWDKLREETYARQKADGRDPGGREAHAAAQGNPGLGRHERRPEAPVRAADGDFRRLRRAHRQRSRAARRAARGVGRARQHAVLLHRRRQRRERRGRARGRLQRDDGVERHRRHLRPDGGPRRRLGQPDHVPALRDRLGLGDQFAVPVDQAGGKPLRRHAQRHGPAVAQGHQGQGRDPQPVPSRDRRRADGARSGRHSRAEDGQRRRAASDGRRFDAVHRGRREGGGHAQDPVLRDVRQPRDLPRGLGRGDAALDSLADGQEPPAPGRRVGALQRRCGLQPGGQPRREEPGKAEGAPGPLHAGGRAELRAADRRPPLGALQPGDRRAARTCSADARP